MFSLLLIAIALLAYFWYTSKRKALQFWQERGFPTLSHAHFIFGDVGECILRRRNFAEFFRDAHFTFKARGHKVGGIYMLNTPVLMIIDPETIKSVLQIDFDAFAARGIDVDAENNPLAYHLFNIDGEAWAMMRRKLSPSFTSGKMKMIFPIMQKHIDALMQKTLKICDHGHADLIYIDWLDRTGIDVIGNVAFGMDCNLIDGGSDTLLAMCRRIMRPKLWKILQMMLCGFRNPANLVVLISSDKELSAFFIRIFKDTVEHRRRNNVKAHDFMQSLIGLFEDELQTPGSGMTLLELAAQAFLFFVAGYETTSRTIDFNLYALAQNTDVQRKLRETIREELTNNNDEFTYDWIMNNEYLDMVVKETMRMYPIVITLNRMATRDYHLKGIDLTVPKDTCIVISSLGVHYDPDFHADPEEYRPERFSKNNAQQMHQFASLPFGQGPRFCIGKRFAYMQVKLTLAKILHRFEILPGTHLKYPLEINPASEKLLYDSKEPFTFRMKPLNA